MAGYFTDGSIHVELGEHVFATAEAQRLNALLTPHKRPGVLLDSGGGILELTVTGQRLRHSLGDAERYVYGLFRALALSGPGELGAEDDVGNRAVFGDALCVEAAAEVRALRFVEMRFRFLAPERASQPGWSSVPPTPLEYPGCGTAQDYAAGGMPVGEHPLLARIEMARACSVRPVPRARGGRAVPVASGAMLSITVQACAEAGGTNLAAHLEQLARDIGPRPVTLSANGNAFDGAALDRLEPVHTDRHQAAFEARFLLPIAPESSTTTAEPTTTTQAPSCPGDCSGMASPLHAAIGSIFCAHVSALSGTANWTRSGCTWTYGSGLSNGFASAITCSGGAWAFTLTHGPTGKTGIYQRTAYGDAPAGLFALTGGTCGDMPETVTVYS